MMLSNLKQVLSQRPLGLAFDIDGTLSPIAPTPDMARLHPAVPSLLEQASKHPGVHVAIMTGRAIDDGAAMVNIPGLTYIGAHGLEWSAGLPTEGSVQVEPAAEAYIQPGRAVLDLAEQHLASLPGFLIERKHIGGAIHYRLCPDPEQARSQILALLQEPARQLHMVLSEGKRVVEIKAPLQINKGKALRRFAERLALRGVLFAGDDRTDLDAVKEIAVLRSEGLVALSVVVRHTDTLPELLARADIVVEEVEGMVALLREIVQGMKSV
jgi:trehalose 6-phosphate phosphatase